MINFHDIHSPEDEDWMRIPDRLELGVPEDADILEFLRERGLQDAPIYRKAVEQKYGNIKEPEGPAEPPK